MVTVVPPGPGAPAGLIASGTVGRERWSARVTEPRHGQVCLKAGAAGIDCGFSASPIGPADLEGGMAIHGYRVLGGRCGPG